jgi:hypothetical protein
MTVTSEHQDIVACKFDTCNRRSEQSVERQILNVDYPSVVTTVSEFLGMCVYLQNTQCILPVHAVIKITCMVI